MSPMIAAMFLAGAMAGMVLNLSRFVVLLVTAMGVMAFVAPHTGLDLMSRTLGMVAGIVALQMGYAIALMSRAYWSDDPQPALAGVDATSTEVGQSPRSSTNPT